MHWALSIVPELWELPIQSFAMSRKPFALLSDARVRVSALVVDGFY